MVDSANLCYWRLGGVMTAFNASFEIFYATRADFILPDGTLKTLTFSVREFPAIAALGHFCGALWRRLQPV